MKQTIFVLFFLANSHSVFAQDIDAAAKDACKCLEAPYELTEKILGELSAAQASGDYSLLLEKQTEIDKIAEDSNQCFIGLQSKYPDIDKSTELQQQVMKVVEQKCPSPFPSF